VCLGCTNNQIINQQDVLWRTAKGFPGKLREGLHAWGY